MRTGDAAHLREQPHQLVRRAHARGRAATLQVRRKGRAVSRIPIFGRAARAAGMIAIERENRKSAFESYRVAAERIRAGASVVVFPEGTRGRDYALRHVQEGSVRSRGRRGCSDRSDRRARHARGDADAIRSACARASWTFIFSSRSTTDGLTYEDRNRLSRAAWDRMASAMHELYGIESDAERRAASRERGRGLSDHRVASSRRAPCLTTHHPISTTHVHDH